MFNSKFNGLLTVLLIIAIIGIVILMGYFGWSVYNKYYIDSSAKNVVESFEEAVSNNKKDENTSVDIGDREDLGSLEGSTNIYTNQTSSGSKTKYGGYEVFGTISIPKINIEYPILEKQTPKSIKIAVAYAYRSWYKQSWKYCNFRT